MSGKEDLLSIILHPIKWFATHKVDELAKTIAIRQIIFREIIRLHFQHYLRNDSGGGKLDPDRSRGLSEKVIEDLQNHFDWTKINPEDQSVRTEIAKAVTMAIVPISVWISLRELRATEPFNPNQYVTLSYQDSHGSTHHSINLIVEIQKEFLFFKPFAFFCPSAGSDISIMARLTPDISTMVDARLKNENASVLQFQLTTSQVDPLIAFQNI